MANRITITDKDSAYDIADKIYTLNNREKDAIYRKLWFDYVVKDIENRLEERELTNKSNDAAIQTAAYAYVYDGEYDCNCTYWSNIDHLIDVYIL